MPHPPPGETLRPRDLAWLLLASRDLLPRQRARDQQADLAGMQLKRRVLDRLAALDPEPADLEATLVRIIEEIGPPTGPTRGIASELRDEWQMAVTTPEWVAQLLGEAMALTKGDGTPEFKGSRPLLSAESTEGKQRGRRHSS